MQICHPSEKRSSTPRILKLTLKKKVKDKGGRPRPAADIRPPTRQPAQSKQRSHRVSMRSTSSLSATIFFTPSPNGVVTGSCAGEPVPATDTRNQRRKNKTPVSHTHEPSPPTPSWQEPWPEHMAVAFSRIPGQGIVQLRPAKNAMQRSHAMPVQYPSTGFW